MDKVELREKERQRDRRDKGIEGRKDGGDTFSLHLSVPAVSMSLFL